MLSVVILAGGFGERLWPASKSTFPKQFMTLKSGLSFFQQSLQRAAMLTCAEKDYVQDTYTRNYTEINIVGNH